MAIIKKKEIKSMSEEESKKRLNELELELLKAYSQKSARTQSNNKLKEIRKTIARILTLMNAKNIKNIETQQRMNAKNIKIETQQR